MKVNLFNGGLSRRLSDNLIQPHEAIEYTNINNSKGSLVPVKNKLDTGIDVGTYAHFYESAAQWVSSNTERHYVEYIDNLYYSEEGSVPKVYNGMDEFTLGIEAPTNAPTVAPTTKSPAIITGATLEKISGSTFPDNSLVSYALVNKYADGTIGRPFFKTINITTGDKSVRIKELVGFDEETVVYRFHANEYRKVGSITSSGGTLDDTTLDISSETDILTTDDYLNLIGTYQYVYTYYASGQGHESGPSDVSIEIDISDEGGTISLSSLQVSTDTQVDKKRIYRVGGNLSIFSLVAEIDNNDTTFLDTVADTKILGDQLETTGSEPAPSGLRFLTEANSILFGAIDNILRFTPINRPELWPTENFIKFEAPVTGIGTTSAGILVYTRIKTYIITGTDSTLFTRYPLSRQQGCISHDTIVDGTNYLLWASTDGICHSTGGPIDVVSIDKLDKIKLDPVNSVVIDEVYYVLQTDGKTLAFDFGRGGVFKEFEFDVDRLVVANDTLYGTKDGRLFQLFGANDNLPMTYTSPRFVENGYSAHKYYKSIYILSEGDLNIRIEIDGIEAANKTLSGAIGAEEIKVDQSKHRGYGMQVFVTGTGSLYEMENKVVGRDNGK